MLQSPSLCPSPPPPKPQATTNLVPVSMDLPILFISYKWNYTIRDLFCLASLTKHNVFRVRSCVAYISTSFSFIGE